MSEPRPQATDERAWLRANEAYLGHALRWLRLRLRRLADLTETTPAEPAPSSSRGLIFRLRERKPPLALPPGRPFEAEIEEAAAAMAAAEKADPPPALTILRRRFGLSRFEQDVLLLCAAIELDTRIAGLCARAQQDPARVYPTFALAMTLFDQPAWDPLSPERPLRYWRLIEINQPGARPLTASALVADERIVNYLKGLNYLDDRLTPLVTPFEGGDLESMPPSQRTAGEEIERALRLASGNGAPPVLQLVGSDPLSKQLVAQRAAGALGLGLYRLPVELLPSAAGELDNLARLWQRESVLLPIALFLDAHELDGPMARGGEEGGPPSTAPLYRFIARCHGVLLLSTREARAGLGPGGRAVEVAKPTAAEQRAAWSQSLGQRAGDSPTLLAGQFDLNTTTIADVVRASLADAASEQGDELEPLLWTHCLRSTAPELDRLAQRLHPVATWDDLVLPEQETALLRQLAGQVAQRARVYDDWGFRRRMNRGFGISALFAGESGTGKTMGAEVIANHLRLHLYRIDLSAVVSKYIGETEKNLRRLFDAAEAGGAILFFDEADALFGKRSEVRDSHDRYANIEINYLLQRMEAYRGLAILATNMKKALDDAFMRRLRFVVTFPFPNREQRRAIWENAWPAETPLDELDYDRLSRLGLTGGSIANVALNAAFTAADQGARVDMPRVLAAARTEFEKLERPINESDFRPADSDRSGRPVERLRMREATA